MPESDIELMLRCGRDPAALGILYDRFENRLIAFIARMVHDRVEAEDLLHETFIRLMRAAPRYEPRASFSTFVYTIARNLCIDHLKKRRGLPFIPLDSVEEASPGPVTPGPGPRHAERPGKEPSPDDASVTAESVAALRRAIAALPDAKREALVLRTQVGLPYAEIAEITGAPVGTVKYRVHEAIRVVAEALGVPRDQVVVKRGQL